MDVLNGFALGILIFLFIGGVYLIIYIHDIPYNIAKKRKHPHLEAIHMAGWISLIFMHAIWPLLWIWAYLFTPDANDYSDSDEDADIEEIKDKRGEIEELTQEVAILKKEMKSLAAQIKSTDK
ncbi:MAG: DUF3302 domain-containing protein [Bacteroidota bacterium]